MNWILYLYSPAAIDRRSVLRYKVYFLMKFDSLDLHHVQEKTDSLSALGNFRYKQKHILPLIAIS